MVFRKKLKLKRVERTFQKNRFFKKPKKLKLKRGNSGFVVSQEARMELVHLKWVRRWFKKVFKKKKVKYRTRRKPHIKAPDLKKRFGKKLKRKKIWYFGKTYFYLQKKSKNSRMGKGKGNIDKKILKLRKNFILFEFYGVSCYKLRWLANKINKKLNFNFLCIFEKHKEYSWWAYSSKYSFFFKKYNLYINR